MLSSNKNLRIIGWVAAIMILLVFVSYLYSIITQRNTISNSTALLIIGLFLGAVIMFLISRLNRPAAVKENIVAENSHTVVESMRKVFKIVFAEGQFNELYNFEETKKIFGFIPSTKRALVIIKAKVLVGFDFEKMCMGS